jgi:hypothetical protein
VPPVDTASIAMVFSCTSVVGVSLGGFRLVLAMREAKDQPKWFRWARPLLSIVSGLFLVVGVAGALYVAGLRTLHPSVLGASLRVSMGLLAAFAVVIAWRWHRQKAGWTTGGLNWTSQETSQQPGRRTLRVRVTTESTIQPLELRVRFAEKAKGIELFWANLYLSKTTKLEQHWRSNEATKPGARIEVGGRLLLLVSPEPAFTARHELIFYLVSSAIPVVVAVERRL